MLLPPASPVMVKVVKSEEKGSDVILATYLMLDAFDNDFEGAVIVSNDSDLAEPIRLVRTRFRHKLVVLYPCSPLGEARALNCERQLACGRVVRPWLFTIHCWRRGSFRSP